MVGFHHRGSWGSASVLHQHLPRCFALNQGCFLLGLGSHCPCLCVPAPGAAEEHFLGADFLVLLLLGPAACGKPPGAAAAQRPVCFGKRKYLLLKQKRGGSLISSCCIFPSLAARVSQIPAPSPRQQCGVPPAFPRAALSWGCQGGGGALRPKKKARNG